MSDAKVEKYYKRQSKDIVDSLFDKRILHPELTRKTLDALEDYLGYILQTTANTATRTAEMVMRIEHRKKE